MTLEAYERKVGPEMSLSPFEQAVMNQLSAGRRLEIRGVDFMRIRVRLVEGGDTGVSGGRTMEGSIQVTSLQDIEQVGVLIDHLDKRLTTESTASEYRRGQA